jgi:type I restriction enzyme S subunit
MVVARPPRAEQQIIVAFLDHETSQIDALIAEQRKLIELLKEKRQATISHAVTKGLNPSAPMKESGIEWLGPMPEHWYLCRLRFVCELNPSKQELRFLSDDITVSFLPMESIGDDGYIKLDQQKQLSDVLQGYTFFMNDDVAIAKITPCFENGKGAVMRNLYNGIGFGTTELIVARPIPEKVASEYLHYIFLSPIFRKLGEGFMYGAGGQKRVPDDFVRNFTLGVPSIAEQKKIVGPRLI